MSNYAIQNRVKRAVRELLPIDSVDYAVRELARDLEREGATYQDLVRYIFEQARD